MKLMLTAFFAVMVYGGMAQARDLSQCSKYDASCSSEVLIQMLADESTAVRRNVLINRMNQQCAYDNVKCTSRFVSRAIRQAFGRGTPGGGGGGSQLYTVTANEIGGANTVRIAWCNAGDRFVSGKCNGYYDPNWAANIKKVTRRRQEG